MAESNPSDVLMQVFEHAAGAKTVSIILEEEDGSIRFHCSTDSLHQQLGMTMFALLCLAGQVIRVSLGDE